MKGALNITKCFDQHLNYFSTATSMNKDKVHIWRHFVSLPVSSRGEQNHRRTFKDMKQFCIKGRNSVLYVLMSIIHKPTLKYDGKNIYFQPAEVYSVSYRSAKCAFIRVSAVYEEVTHHYTISVTYRHSVSPKMTRGKQPSQEKRKLIS